MLQEDIYRDLVVRGAETKKDSDRTTFVCELEGSGGQNVGFSLIIEGCVGQARYQAQHRAVAELCTEGALLHCSIVYRRRSGGFVMCIDQMMRMQPVRLDDGSPIDVDAYLDAGRGFWVRTESASAWVDIPGVIELHGESCIPIVEDRGLPHVNHSYNAEYGLLYGKRRSVVQRIWNWAFA